MLSLGHFYRRFLTPGCRLYLKNFFFILFIALFFRGVFYLWNLGPALELGAGDLAYSLYLGLKFDARLAQLLALPWLLLSFIPLFDLLRLKIVRIILYLYSHLVFFLLLACYFTDFGFFAYLENRLNASVFKFFENPAISAQMVWQTYPVVWLALLVAIVLFFYQKLLLNRWMKSYVDENLSFQSLRVRFLANFLCFFFFAGMVYGKFAYYPLRWSEAYFTPKPIAPKLTLNPVLNIVDTLKYTDQKQYSKEAVEEHYSLIADYLGVDEPDGDNLNFIRHFSAKDSPLQGFNVVIVMMESLSTDKTSLSGNPLDPTPVLATLAENSVFFPNHYTPTEATARGVYTSIIAHPDLTKGKGSSSRNPFIVDQHSILNQFEGYERFYFLGGSANWGNIRGLFTNNIDGIHMYEEGSYSSPRVDVWGISDIDLFLEADKVFKQQQHPFVAFIQTSGFHRPYTIPEDNHGFQWREAAAEDLKKYSFISEQQFNSMSLQDHALGVFLERAKESGYYDKTLFVIYGDHGVTATSAEHIPQGFIKHRLTAHWVPLLFHAPKALEPREDLSVASQMDIMPSITSLLGIPYSIQTMGRSLFDEGEKDRFSFLYTWHAGPQRYALVGPELLYVKEGDSEGLYRYKTENFDNDVSSESPEDFQYMKKLGEGLMQTGRYMMFHNKKLTTGDEQ